MDQTDMLIIAGGDGTLQEVQKYLHKVGLFKKILLTIWPYLIVCMCWILHTGDNWPTAQSWWGIY